MPDPLLNTLMRTPAATPAGRHPRDAGDADAFAADSFSQTLEKRMNSSARPPAGAGDTASRPPPERAQRQASASEHPNAKPPNDAAAADGTRDARETAERDASPTGNAAAAPGEPESDTGAIPSSPAASDSDRHVAAADADAAVTAADAAPPSVDPSLAATLAGLMPNVAALPAITAAVARDGVDVSVDASASASVRGNLVTADAALDDGPGTGGSLLEKLIEKIGGKTMAGATGRVDAASDDSRGDRLGALAARSWRAPVEPADAKPAAIAKPAAEAPAVRAAPQLAGAAMIAGTPAAASAPPHPDAQTMGLHAAGAAAPLRGEQLPIPQLPVHTPAGQRIWAEDVGAKMMWMVGRNESKAELILTPPHLGKLEVSIHVSGDQTVAHFVAATSAARAALEEAMPRLREMMQQAGVALGQTNVSTSGDPRAGRDDGSGGRRGARSGGIGFGALDAIQGTPLPTAWSRVGAGMVDTFA